MTYSEPIYDHPFQGEMPSPDFSESQMWNFTDGKYGVIYHIGSMPSHLRLSHNAFAITCPDGSVLATKIVGRPEEGCFGSKVVFSRTIVPYKSWQICFDGGLRRYRPGQLWTGPGTDGRHVPAKINLEVSATHDIWEPGLGSEDATQSLFATSYKMHHEQALRTKGIIEIDGETIEFEAIGHRDHSFGPRDMSKALRGHWVNGTFDSGWSFIGMNGEMDPTGLWERAAIFQDGKIIPVSVAHNGQLSTPAPEPRKFEIVLHPSGKPARTVQIRCTHGVNWFSSGPSEWCVGSDLSDPSNYNWSMYFAEMECEGERGTGFVDRGAHASFMRSLSR